MRLFFNSHGIETTFLMSTPWPNTSINPLTRVMFGKFLMHAMRVIILLHFQKSLLNALLNLHALSMSAQSVGSRICEIYAQQQYLTAPAHKPKGQWNCSSKLV